MKKLQHNSAHILFLQLTMCVALLALSAIVFASTFPGAPHKSYTDRPSISPSLSQPTTPLDPSPQSSCPSVITQSTSQAITTYLLPCLYAHPPPGGAQAPGSYWRAFNMANFTNGSQYNVNSVSFGIYYANNPQSVTVRLYRNSGGAFPGGTRTQLTSTTININPQSGTVLTTPLAATVPADVELVMEVFSPGGAGQGNTFYVGANTAPETGPSYWSCDAWTPQVANTHFVFDVNGSCPSPSPTPTPMGTPATLGNYPDTTILLSSNTTVTPVTSPTNTSAMNVFTSTSFQGQLEADPVTGIVRITDAHPAGTYAVTVRASNGSGPSATKTFPLTIGTPATCAPVSFAAGNFGVGNGPSSVAVGDFNRDGKQDLAVTTSGGVSILLGFGAGGFSAPTTFGAGDLPSSVAVGDFNGDGRQDLAVANFFSNSVSILLGDGAGSFNTATDFDAGNYPISVAIGDWNGDGKQDLVTTNYYSASVSALLGNGSGSFSDAATFGTANGSGSVVAGDFNNDGKQDLATANYNASNISILLGYGSGYFPSAVNFGVGTRPNSIALGDFNNDGHQDLAVANQGSNNVSILLGNGSGNFTSATNYNVALDLRAVAVGDFNGDGNQDLAVASFASNNISILLGNGLGGFSTGTTLGVGPDSGPSALMVGDFDGDGKQDLAVANQISDNVSILLRGCGPIPTPTPTCNYVYTIGTGSIVPGTTDIGNHADEATTVIALPFPYTLYDQTFNSVGVGTDGYLAFGTVYGFSWGQCIPDIDATYAIGAFWADQQTYNQLLGAFTSTSGVAPNRIFNIEWRTDYRWGGCGGCGVRLKYEVRLYEGQQAYDVIYGVVDSRPFSNDGVLSVGVQKNNQAGAFTLVGCDPTGGEAPPVSAGQLYHYTLSCGPGPSPSPTPTSTPSPVNISGMIGRCTTTGPSGIALANVTVTLTGTSRDSTQSNSSGNYILSCVFGGTYTVTPSKPSLSPGAAGITTVDAIAVQRHFLNVGTPLSGCRLSAADCAPPAGINTGDVIAIQRFFLANTTGIGNVGKYQFNPVNRAYSSMTNDQAAQNYEALIFGDVAAFFAE